MRCDVKEVGYRARLLSDGCGGAVVFLPNRDEQERQNDGQDRPDRPDDRAGDVVVREFLAARDDMADEKQAAGRKDARKRQDRQKKEPRRYGVNPGHAKAFAREGAPPRTCRAIVGQNATPASRAGL